MPKDVQGGNSRPRIAVVGSYAVGMTVRTEKAPSRGETVEGYQFSQLDGGKGSNQAVACARLGCHVTFVGCVGADSLGDRAVALYEHEGVDYHLLKRHESMPTGVGFIIVEDSGENSIVVDFGANRALTPEDVHTVRHELEGAKVVLTQLEIEPATAEAAMAVGREIGAVTVLNPAPYRQVRPSMWPLVDVVTPNTTEARLILGLPLSDESPPAELAERIADLGTQNVILTLGGDGAFVKSPSFTGHIPARDVQVKDTTGAGDAFAAALATSLAEGRSLHDAARSAVAAAALSVTEYGVIPSLPYRADVARLMAQG
jgi:ribokinase